MSWRSSRGCGASHHGPQLKMGNCSSAPRLKVNLRSLITASPNTDGYGDEWYFETMNVLLDRWTNSHVQFLRKKFLEATGDKGEKELDKKGFFKLFSELQDMPKAVAESAFRMFDTDNSGKLNFREFCCALALCCHLMSSDDEKIRFVFDMFDTNDDGLLNSADVQLLLEYAFGKEDPALSVDGADKDASLLARKQQRIADMKQDLLGSTVYLSFERFYEWASKNIDSLTNLLHTFQIVPSPERERAICEEILSRHKTLTEGGTWYCISYKWLQVWKAHANWKGPSPGRRASSHSSSGGHGLLVVGSDTNKRERGISGEKLEIEDYDVASDVGLGILNDHSLSGMHHMLTRPPEIDNSDLEGEHKGELKMNLVEHLDYELIPEEMWQRLVEWYGGGPAIPRKVICMGEDHQPQVELYPPLVLVVVAGESGQPLPQFSRRFFISRQTSLEEVLTMLAEKLSRPADRSRLWHRAKGAQWGSVNQMGMMLDEFLEGKVWDAGAFMLETMKPSNEWPRDTIESHSCGSDSLGMEKELQRHFEVGDRVEAQNGVTNQWMRGTIVDVIQRDHSTAPSQVKVHYDSTVYKCDEWISTSSDRLAPIDTHTTDHPATSSTATPTPENEGPPLRGATGLQNLGNTCFLNATIQCLANTPLLKEYFLSTQYMRDINERGAGCKGRLAEEFGNVLADLWAAKMTQLSPRNLKRTIDQFAPQFAGYEQHDAQELLAFFLDGLHEDLNRFTGPNASTRPFGMRREAGTPKLFSRAKPPYARMAGGSSSASREVSPKRAKSAWRDRGANAESATPGSKTANSESALGNTPDTSTTTTTAQHNGPAHTEDRSASGIESTAPSSKSKEAEAAEEDTVKTIEASADAATLQESGDNLALITDLPDDLPDDEAYRTVDRLVHPTMLWSRPRPGGAFTTDTASEKPLHAGDDMHPSPEETLPSNPKVSSPGLGALSGVGVGRPQTGGASGADEFSERVPAQQASALEAAVDSLLETEARESIVRHGDDATLGSQENSGETSALLELTEEFGDERLSQDLPICRLNEYRAVQASAGNFQQSMWQRRYNEDGAQAEAEKPAEPDSAEDHHPDSGGAAAAGKTGTSASVTGSTQGKGSSCSDEVHKPTEPAASSTSGAAPSSASTSGAGGASASGGNASRRDANPKQPGTSRWWSFAWRRSGRGALDLPKDPGAEPGIIEADKNRAQSPAATSAGANSEAKAETATAEAKDTLHSGSLASGAPSSATTASDLHTGTARSVEALGRMGSPRQGIGSACGESDVHASDGAAGNSVEASPPEAAEVAREITQMEEQRSRLPVGTAVAAVTAAAAVRVSQSDVSEDGTVGTFNESEDFVPELLTPHQTVGSGRRSLNLFSRSFRKKRSDDDGPAGSPKRRPRTPPTMTPLREEQPGMSANYLENTGMSQADPALRIAPPLPGGDHCPSGTVDSTTHVTELVPASTPGSGRSFLPWKGKRAAQERRNEESRTREASCEEESDGRATGTQPGAQGERPRSREDGRVGRTKEKESSWPSFLRRSKSREGSMARRTRPSGPRGPGTTPLVAAGDRGEGTDEQADSSARGASSDEVRHPRDLSEPRKGSDHDSDERPVPRPSGLGFPFLRAPWKRERSSPSKARPIDSRSTESDEEKTRTTNEEPQDAAEHREELGDDESKHFSRDVPPETPNDNSRDNARDSAADHAKEVPREPLREAAKEALKSQKESGNEERASNTKEGTTESQGDDEDEAAETDEDQLPDEEKAVRQWERYRARNRSLIVDIFEGQLRSQLTCCQCGATSSTFEPFRYLSVPIPSNHVDRACLRVIFFPLPYSRGEERPQLLRYSICVPKSSTVQKVERALSRLLPVPMTSALLAEVYRSRIHRYLETGLPLSDVRAEDQLFAFEVLQTPEDLMQYQERFAPSRGRKERNEDLKKQPQPRVLLIQAMHRRVVDVCRSDGRTWAQRREVFGLPFVMSAASSWTYATLHDMLMLHARRFLKSSRRDRRSDAGISEDRQAATQMPFVARIVNASGTACGACDRRNCTGCLLPKGNSRLRLRAGLLTGAVSTAKIYLALDWVDSGVYDQEYVDTVADDASVARANATEFQDAETDRSHNSDAGKSDRDDKRNASIGKVPISTCIDAFAQPEELKQEFGNGVKCEKCNQVVDAVKKLEIWREPDVLIIHIKRFHFSGVHYEKLNTPVEVPFRELNLRPWIVGPMATTVAPYELYAVACHWGGMSGGHYTSYAVNGEGKEPVWLKYNDEVVNSVSLQQELDEISRQCYVLFYRKRAFTSSNLINYSSLL